MARIEVQIAIKCLLQRFPNIQLNTEVIERPKDYTVRSIKSLPVRLKNGKGER